MNTLKVAIHFPNSTYSEVDLTHPEAGNPGIGGTAFNFITMPFYFDKFYQNVEWYFLAESEQNIPEHFHLLVYKNDYHLGEIFDEHNFDFFIWKPAKTFHIVNLINRKRQNAIAWCNNIPVPDELDQIAESEYVKAVVFAGHEALDTVRDHAIILKSTVIYNGFDGSKYVPSSPVVKEKNTVVYLGSLVPTKCFHLLAKAWPEVLKRKPDAKLKVIGSGKLYDRNLEVGEFGIAEKNYEDLFMEPLKTPDGEIHDSVDFLGLMGDEKIPVMQQASVGVINPHGMSEVCPGSMIEFSACETAIVAGARYGNLDTAENKKTGLLSKSIDQLVADIVSLLDNPDLATKMGKNGRDFVLEKFNYEGISTKWHSLFIALKNGQKLKAYPMKSNWTYNFKIAFEMLRILKFKMGLFKGIPSAYTYIMRKKAKHEQG